jgi:hypothetical protein
MAPHSLRTFLHTIWTGTKALTGALVFAPWIKPGATAAQSDCVTVSAGPGQWHSRPLSAVRTATFETTATATPLGSAIDGAVALSNEAQTTFPGLACIVRFNQAGLIDVRDGTVYRADAVIPYVANTTYVVRVAVDVESHRYSAYVRPLGGAEQTVATAYAFRSEQSTVGELDTHTLFADVGSLRVCSFADEECLVVSTGLGWRAAALPPQSGVFTVEWDAVASNGALDLVMALGHGAPAEFTGYACLVRFHNISGQIQVRDGGTYRADAIVQYAPNTVYHLRVVADVPQRRYDVWVTPEGGQELQLAAGYAFRTEQQEVTVLDTLAAIIDAGPGAATVRRIQAPEGETGVDRFGIAMLYPTVGRTWEANWDNGHPRTLTFGKDPDDPWANARGTATYTIDGNGIMTADGPTVRFYVFDPNYPGQGQPGPSIELWNNVEATVYMKRSDTSGVAYGGAVLAAKIRHIPDSDLCGTRGYYGRLRNDGGVDFEKEIRHPTSVPRTGVDPWATFPVNQWVGVKLVCRDTADGTRVKLELWRDLTDGADGGTWELVDQEIDAGGWGAGQTPCATGQDPAKILTGPNLSVFFRNDSVNDVQYKRFSIREVPPAEN